jgi:glycine cleavage system H protein
MEFPEELKYTEEHEWVRIENGQVRVGITDFAQDALGDVVYVDIPEAGAAIRAGEPFGEVESTKSVSDVYAPVTGTVLNRNQRLSESPQLVNEDPYGEGWMVLVEPADSAELDGLMDASMYREFTQRDAEG